MNGGKPGSRIVISGKEEVRKKKIITIIATFLISAIAGYAVLGGTKREDIYRDMAAGAVAALADMPSVLTQIPSEDYLVSIHVYSHRGKEGPIEHSFEAYDAAISEGSRYIEQDIVISKNGTVYVAHDPSAYRMTGVQKLYADMTDEKIGSLRTYEGKEILKLSDVFDRYGRSVNYVIELKSSDQSLTNAFADLINNYDYDDIVIAQCGYLEPLESLKQKYPEMPMLYVCRTKKQIEEGLDRSYIDIIGARKDLMTQENCSRAHQAGKRFAVWTVNSKKEIEKAISIDADAYFTDNTARAIEMEKKLR